MLLPSTHVLLSISGCKQKRVSITPQNPICLIFRLLLWLACVLFSRTVAAQSTSDLNDTSPELKVRAKFPPFPSLQNCRDHIVHNMPPEDKAIFYTRVVGDEERYTNARVIWEWKNGLFSISRPTNWDPWDFLNRKKYKGNNEGYRAFVRNYSIAFTEHARGRVYLLMPYTLAPRKDSLFWEIEWPIIKRGGKVTEVIWIDTGLLLLDEFLPAKEKAQKLWWKAGDKLPVTYPSDLTSEEFAAELEEPSSPTPTPIATGSQKLKKKRKKPSNNATPTPTSLQSVLQTLQSSISPLDEKSRRIGNWRRFKCS